MFKTSDPQPPAPSPQPHAFTLVEMLIAMAITLVMMGAVVTLFANVSSSVRNRRAVVELNGQLRHVRNVLQRDLQGATCSGLVWQRPDENQGYIEIIEGPNREWNPSLLTDGIGPPVTSPSPANPEIDYALSFIPQNNVVGDYNGSGGIDDNDRDAHFGQWSCYLVRETQTTDSADNDDSTNPFVTSSNGLGDGDDILMLTVRNEHEPFVGRVPESDSASKTSSIRPDDTDADMFGRWSSEIIESPLAEVVWYAVENPGYTSSDLTDDYDGFFGEPGFRTIYRRTLLIAPWINPYRHVASDGTVTDTFQIDGDSTTFTAKPGLVRILPDSVDRDEGAIALAALIAFQEAYDLSVRVEFDPLLGDDGRWKLVANTLGDLTKRENRYEHHFFDPITPLPPPRDQERVFPYAVVSMGSEYGGDDVTFVVDPDVGGGNNAQATAIVDDYAGITGAVVNYTIDPNNLESPDPPTASPLRYRVRPFAYIDDDSTTLSTARVMLNDEGEVVRVVHGLVPLSGDRRGEDVMLTDALGFDLRVYDPGAPIFAHVDTETVLEPTDTSWTTAYLSSDNMADDGSGAIGTDVDVFPFAGQGAYVDLGYGFDIRRPRQNSSLSAQLPEPTFAPAFTPATTPWFFTPRALSNIYGDVLAPGYAVFDTWSFHYENNGLNEDQDEVEGGVWQLDDFNGMGTPLVDEGTNGIDDFGTYEDPTVGELRLGPDDVGERETIPPYNRPLRSLQIVLRLYERDSRQLRQVRVNQSFVPE